MQIDQLLQQVDTPLFVPENWYWFIAGDTTQVYSSARSLLVPVADATYQTWLSNPKNKTYNAASTTELSDILDYCRVDLPPQGKTSDAHNSARVDELPRALKVWAFDVENRVRVLEGKSQLTSSQFKSYIKSLM